MAFARATGAGAAPSRDGVTSRDGTGTGEPGRPPASRPSGDPGGHVAPAWGHELHRVAATRAFSGPGAPADAGARAAVERATGQSLGDVRVHTGPRVRVAARALRAAAFTVGRDIGLATAPGETAPRALLEHELVHAAQQRVPAIASREQAEAQAQRGAALAGPLAGAGPAYVACAAEDWLHSTPNVGRYGFTELVDELRAVDEWLSRQMATTPEVDRMQEARTEIQAEITRRQRAMRPPPRGRGRRGRGAAEAAPTAAEVPRVLRERTSEALADPAEIRAEVDRIAAWLQRRDVSRADRAILEQELRTLAPQWESGLAEARATRQATRLSAVLQPAGGAGRAELMRWIRLVESIRPYAEQPGSAYVIHDGELHVFPQELADRVQAQVAAALRDGVTRARGMNVGTEERLSAHLRLNYQEQPVVGFAVSVVTGEEPVALQERVHEPLGESQVAVIRFDAAQRRGSLTAMAEAMFTAVEQADRASRLMTAGVDRSIAGAGAIVTGLEITRNVSFAVALSIGAILAAPVVAAGVAGAGFTGLTATGLTALGTGTVVGAEGALLGFTSGTAGELAAGSDLRTATAAGLDEGGRVARQGFAIGVGGGATAGLARNLGVGATGLTRGANLGRNMLAQGGGNALGSATGALLTPPQPDGPGRGEAALYAGLTGFGLGAFGGAAGTYGAALGSPGARWAAGVGAPGLLASGTTYALTGDPRLAFETGVTSLTVGSVGLRAASGGPLPGEARAFQLGQSARASAGGFATSTGRVVRPWLAAAMIGASEAVPAVRMPVGSAPVTTQVQLATGGGGGTVAPVTATPVATPRATTATATTATATTATATTATATTATTATAATGATATTGTGARVLGVLPADAAIRMFHGTSTSGVRGMEALGEGRIDVRHSPGEHQDLGQGFYLTLDADTATAYGVRRSGQRGAGEHWFVLQFSVHPRDLGTVVDVRPGGNFRAQWEQFLDQPPFPELGAVPGIPGTNREYLAGLGSEQRGVYFERFLRGIGMGNADTLIAPIGEGVFSGISSGEVGVQVCIRSQAVADRLNAQIRGETPPAR